VTGFARIDDCVLHYTFREGRGPAVVFLNSLGTDLRIWDGVVDALPTDLCLLRMDKRGHGLSETAPGDMARFAADAAGLMDRFGLSRALICGVSIGGMIAQELALSRPDLVGGLLLSNTAAKIGDAAGWQDRLFRIETDGLPAMADGVLDRWFPRAFKDGHPDMVAGYRTMLSRTDAEGYSNACRALAGADLRDRVGTIACPTVVIGGSEDGSTPPDVVRGLADAIPGADYIEIGGAGHLPCIQTPGDVAAPLMDLHRRIS